MLLEGYRLLAAVQSLGGRIGFPPYVVLSYVLEKAGVVEDPPSSSLLACGSDAGKALLRPEDPLTGNCLGPEPELIRDAVGGGRDQPHPLFLFGQAVGVVTSRPCVVVPPPYVYKPWSVGTGAGGSG